MPSVRNGLIVLSGFAFAACNDNSGATSPKRALSGPSFEIVNAGNRVTGSATILLPNFDNALERYSVSAIRHDDGSVSGDFEEFSAQEGGQRIHANVVCFNVTGNSARLAAQIDQTNVSFGPVGSYVVWSVIDNGEGAKSPPDQTTDIFFGGNAAQAQFHCDVGFNLAPFFESLRGNLQVD